MAKSFKKFRENDWDDDEWGSDDYRQTRKEQKMEKRRRQRRTKYDERAERFAEDFTKKQNKRK